MRRRFSENSEDSFMHRVTINTDICKECGYCIHFCPRQGVLGKSPRLNKKGYYPAQVEDSERCTACGTCALCCPEAAITVERDA
jgi:2-oxoglutarate ferredoxin oxidoreductase subunit delta